MQNFAYLTHPHLFLAYNGFGGSHDLDVQKHWDLLAHIFGCYDPSHGTCAADVADEPFDMALDLGSDHGSVTEKMLVRKFAKDYILLDAMPAFKEQFAKRLGDGAFLSRFFQEQVPDWPAGKEFPHIEMLSYGVSNISGGSFDMCSDPGKWKAGLVTGQPCPVDILSIDSIMPGKLSPVLQDRFAKATSLYIKVSLNGMDQLAVQGMHELLGQVRGTYLDGSPRYLVNFMMLEFCPLCQAEIQNLKGLRPYNLRSQVENLQSEGFEVFLIGPHYLPLTHGSWNDSFMTISNPAVTPSWGTSNLFAMRASQPQATQIKLALGACAESPEFHLSEFCVNHAGEFGIPWV